MTLHACMHAGAGMPSAAGGTSSSASRGGSVTGHRGDKGEGLSIAKLSKLYQIPSEPCQVYPCSTLGAKGRPIHTTVACRLQVGILMSWHSNVLQQGCLMTPKTARGYTLAAP